MLGNIISAMRVHWNLRTLDKELKKANRNEDKIAGALAAIQYISQSMQENGEKFGKINNALFSLSSRKDAVFKIINTKYSISEPLNALESVLPEKVDKVAQKHLSGASSPKKPQTDLSKSILTDDMLAAAVKGHGLSEALAMIKSLIREIDTPAEKLAFVYRYADKTVEVEGYQEPIFDQDFLNELGLHQTLKFSHNVDGVSTVISKKTISDKIPESDRNLDTPESLMGIKDDLVFLRAARKDLNKSFELAGDDKKAFVVRYCRILKRESKHNATLGNWLSADRWNLVAKIPKDEQISVLKELYKQGGASDSGIFETAQGLDINLEEMREAINMSDSQFQKNMALLQQRKAG